MGGGWTHAFPDPGDQGALAYLRALGTVFAEFGAATQDSGNISYGVEIAHQRCFVKTAGHPDDPLPASSHAQRVGLLRNAAELRRACDHPLLPALHAVIESAQGPWLVYAWAEGVLLRREQLVRFRGLDAERILAALDAIFDLHRRLAALGFIMEDFYDGSLIYDFTAHRLRVIDLDCYRQGPSVNPGRRFGSTRFMAPEESQPGAPIDERTSVYTLGRTAALLLSDGTLDRPAFRGSDLLRAAVARACDPDRARRHASVAGFVDDWLRARSDSVA